MSTNSSQFAREVLDQEARAILQVRDLLDSTFDDAVRHLLNRPPSARIIVSGMGKAGFISMKISATLSSLGFPAFFLHPADAIHGDLGRCIADDTVIIFSNSGETTEIVRLLPTLKRIGSRIISVTASKTSTLGRFSDICLALGKIDEVGPLGLAPTATTTAMLALGDALAMTLVEKRGFTQEEFAVFHPGGELGRKLIKVSDIMRSGDAHCILTQSTIVKSAIHFITETRGRPGAAAIVDDQGVLVGVFTDGNLRRELEQGVEFLLKPVATVMTRTPKTVTPDKLAQEIARIMKETKIDQVLVVDELNKPVGLVDIQDLLSHGLI